MKHRRQTITISKILEVFSQTPYPQIALYTSETKTQTLDLNEFELLLLSLTDSSCESSFIIQKYIPSDSEIHVLLNFITESITVPSSVSDTMQETLSVTRRILKYLSCIDSTLFSGELFWRVHNKVPYLYSVVLKHKVVTRIRCSSARSHKPPQNPSNIKKVSRPVTASVRRDSISTARSQSVINKAKNSIETQTELMEKCDCEECCKKLTEELNLLMSENERLEKNIAEALEDGKRRIKEAEEKWKERSLEISKVISDKFFGENVD